MRLYKGGWMSLAAVLAVILSCRGKKYCPRKLSVQCDCQSKGQGRVEITCPSNTSSPLVRIEKWYTNLTVTCLNYSREALSATGALELGEIGLQVASFADCPVPDDSYGDLLMRMGISYLNMLFLSGFRSGEPLEGRHLSGLATLSRLTVAESGLTSLAGDLVSLLPDLRHINISNNALTALPRGLFRSLSYLQELTICEKGLKRLDAQVFLANFSELAVVHLEGNGLSRLSREEVDPFHRTHSLSFRVNRLVRLDPDVFASNKRLEFLFFDNNLLRELPEGLLRNCTNLIRLGLSHNRLEHLPATIFNTNRKLKTLTLDNNRLTTLSGSLFAGLTRLQNLTLNNNSIVRIDNRTFDSVYKLADLDLSSNNLTDVGSILPLLKYKIPVLKCLRLESNNLTRLSEEAVNLFAQTNTLKYIGLYDNPWTCDCQALPMAAFLHNNFKKVALPRIKCEDGSLVVEIKESQVCPSPVWMWAIAGGMLCGLGLVSLSMTTLYYKYTQEIKVWLYAHRLCSCWVTQDDLDKDKSYDAFVSYASQDQHFVVEQLVPVLEDQLGYKLCLHYRDWPVGDFISSQIVRSVEQSKRTIVVLSNNFVNSVWGKMELRTAHSEALGQGRVKVIVILYEELDPGTEHDPELRAYLLSRTYLSWGHPSFWNRLLYALPPRPPTHSHVSLLIP